MHRSLTPAVCNAQIMVGEPSVADTISILRGLSEKYSSFHGVRVADRALVLAAELSSRYIQGRFLPDKAIDLVDEACSNMRVQLESMPEEMDMMQRQQYRLQVEEAALAKEKDKVPNYPLTVSWIVLSPPDQYTPATETASLSFCTAGCSTDGCRWPI